MLHTLIRTGAALVGLAGLAIVGPAHAVAPMPFNGIAPLLIQVTDEGTYINEEERPNQVRPARKSAPARSLRSRKLVPATAARAMPRYKSCSAPFPRRNGRPACARNSSFFWD